MRSKQGDFVFPLFVFTIERKNQTHFFSAPNTSDPINKFQIIEQEPTNTQQEDMKSVMPPTERAEFEANVTLL